jgi:hypothetical protein
MASSRPATAGMSIEDRWLGRCEGFRVESERGRIGYVEEVLFSSEWGPPEFLRVRGGRLGQLRLVITIDEVQAIFPREELIVVRRPTVIQAELAA